MNEAELERRLAQARRHIVIREARDPNIGGMARLPAELLQYDEEAMRAVREMVRHAIAILDAEEEPPTEVGGPSSEDQAATET